MRLNLKDKQIKQIIVKKFSCFFGCTLAVFADEKIKHLLFIKRILKLGLIKRLYSLELYASNALRLKFPDFVRY